MLSMKTVDRPSFFASQIHLMDRHLSKIAKELKRGLSKRNTLQGTGMYSVSWSYNRGGSRIFEGGAIIGLQAKQKKVWGPGGGPMLKSLSCITCHICHITSTCI